MLISLGLLLTALLLRRHTLVVFGSLLLVGYLLLDGGHPEYLFYDLWDALQEPSLLAVPPLLLIAVIITEGTAGKEWAHGLMRLGERYPLTLPGLALCSVVLVAAITGSAAVAILLTGGALYPSLRAHGYSEQVVIALICLGGVIGTLFPPSLMLAVFATLAEASLHPVLLYALGVAGLLLLALCGYALVRHGRVLAAAREALPVAGTRGLALVLLAPAGLFGLIWAVVNPLEGALAHALLVLLITLLFLEGVIFRSLNGARLWRRGQQWVAQLGRLLPLLALSLALTTFLLYQDYAGAVIAWLHGLSGEPAWMVAGTALLAVVLGGISDPLAGLAIVTPLILPVADAAGLTAAQLGTLSVLSLNLGQLLYPAGSALMAAVYVFRVDAATVLKAVAPLAFVLWALLIALIVWGY